MQQINTKPQALVSRMPGSKRRHLSDWALILSQGFTTVVEYFGGALWASQALIQAEHSTVERVIVAEAATPTDVDGGTPGYSKWQAMFKAGYEVIKA